MSGRFYVGVDFGGSTIRVGSLTVEGDFEGVARATLARSDSASEVIERAGSMIDEVIGARTGELAGIGLAVTGPVDVTTGLVANPWTLPSLTGTDVRRPFEDRYRVPVVIENDADAAALGDYFCGGGSRVDSLAMVTVGTGIGVALVRDGRVFRGGNAYHQEAGHHAVADTGPTCYCGIDGCWEQLASGPALLREAEAAIRDGGWDPGGAITSARDVTAAADAGDPVALALVAQVGFYLGRGLRNIEAFYAPARIAIGGGLGQRFDLLAAGIENGRAPASSLSPRAHVVASSLGDDAGVIGAACSVRARLTG